MKQNFDNFIKEIPDNIHSRTKVFISENIAIFKPEKFVTNQSMTMDDYHFIILHSKPPKAVINGITHSFKKGSLISLIPGTSIAVLADSNNNTCKYISVSVKKYFMNKIALETSGTKEIIFDKIENQYNNYLLDVINNFEYEIMAYGNSPLPMLRSLEIQLSILLIRNSLPDRSILDKNIRLDDDYIRESIAYMHKFYSGNITIEDICKEIYLSVSHFKRVFKNKTGKTPYQFLTEIRIEKAKGMLKEKNRSINEIARLCGFVNPGNLSLVFKKHMNMSPSEYKKKQIETTQD
ncbi:MAG: helix-turn-helix transcriptional regulator [Clostridiales bacterium]|nr:helix-turn-helix transcriptional regulator [Clostridiales bacterium]